MTKAPPTPRGSRGCCRAGVGVLSEAAPEVDESAPDHAERDEPDEDALVSAAYVPVNDAQEKGSGGHQTSAPTSTEE